MLLNVRALLFKFYPFFFGLLSGFGGDPGLFLFKRVIDQCVQFFDHDLLIG